MTEKTSDYVVRDAYGEVRSRFNLEKSGLKGSFAEIIKEAFYSLNGHNSVESQRGKWSSLRKLAAFINETYADQNRLPPSILEDFRAWLSRKKLSDSTKSIHFNDARRTLEWISSNYPGSLHNKTNLLVLGFSYSNPGTSKKMVDEADIRAILHACYNSIDETILRIKKSNRIVAGDCENEAEESLRIVLRQFLDIGNGRIPQRSVLTKKGKRIVKLADQFGGVRALRRMCLPGPEDIFPFYLAIIIQTSGNPAAVQMMMRDCVRQHSLRTDRRSVVWMKPRSGREQTVDFSTQRPRSAPNLISQLLAINECLVTYASPRHADKLFLADCNSVAAVPCTQLLHILLDDFISIHGLSNFDFKQLRKSGAVFHARSTGDIQTASIRLNHRSVNSTMRYVSDSLITEQNDRLINKFQGELIKISLKHEIHSKPMSRDIERPPNVVGTETLFGFSCRDPYGGVAANSVVGKLCPKFEGCATCRNAIIVVDDINVVKKIVNSIEALMNAKERALLEGWQERFDAIYLPILEIINRDILPRISASLIVSARSTLNLRALPVLE